MKTENKQTQKVESKKVESKKVESKKVESKQVESKQVESKQVEVKRPTTNAGLFQLFGKEGVKDRKELATNIFEEHKKEGRDTAKGKPITLDKIHQQVSAMIRDINNTRKGWWDKLEVKEDKDSLKIVEKVQLPK